MAEVEAVTTETVRQNRRVSQDYSRLDDFLPLSVWQRLQKASGDRHRAEILSEFCFASLGLRLPSEGTYGTMTAVMISFDSCKSQSEFYDGVQIVKAAWHSTSKRLKKRFADDKGQLLLVLPSCAEGLPDRERESFRENPPATEGERLHSSASVQRLATLGPLRGTHSAVKEVKERRQAAAAEDPTVKLLRALAMFLPDRSCEGRPQGKPDKGLTNLRILTPRKLPMGSERSMQERESCLSASVPEVAGGDVAAARAVLALPAPPPAESLALVAVAPQDSVVSREERVSVRRGPAACEAARERGTTAQCHMAEQREPVCETGKAEERERGQVGPACVAAAQNERPMVPAGESKLRKDAAAFLAERQQAPLTRGKGLKRPAAAPSASKSKKVALKRPASRVECKGAESNATEEETFANFSFKAMKWGECRAEFYKQKSYIRRWDDATGKYVMVIGSCEPHHRQICQQLSKQVQAGKSREALLKERTRISRTFL